MSNASFEGRHVLITGACGTVGAELVRQVQKQSPARVVCIDNNESALFFMQQDYAGQKEIECYLTDLRDRSELTKRMEGTEIVLHAAALKHVGLCEESPVQAIRTNIDGTQNVIDAALEHDVERVIFTSSDKAVNPTNVMGTSKLMGERLVTAASQRKSRSRTIFASTRFGNVLGSRGSVIPLFKQQIAAGGPIKLTDRRMTRFVMTLDEAAKLVLRSVWLACGGEVFVPKMPIARIEDIAITMNELLGDANIEVVEIGSKPGEKLYEELMNDEEVRRCIELEEYFVVLPASAQKHHSRFPYIVGRGAPDRPYNSSIEAPLTRKEVKHFLQANGIA